jgi:uncharacterized OsmC-like protein
VSAKVKLDRSRPDEVIFGYEVEFQGDLTPPQREALFKVAENCPVKATLLKRISFKYGVD